MTLSLSFSTLCLVTFFVIRQQVGDDNPTGLVSLLFAFCMFGLAHLTELVSSRLERLTEKARASWTMHLLPAVLSLITIAGLGKAGWLMQDLTWRESWEWAFVVFGMAHYVGLIFEKVNAFR